MPKIVVNGKSYSSVDEMPPEIRQAYEQTMGILADKNQNGVPDILEGAMEIGSINVQSTPITISSSQFVVDGKTYSNVDELPLEARDKYEQAMAKLGKATGDHNQSGVPDILAGGLSIRDAPPASSPWSDTGSDETAHYRGLLLLAGVVIVILVIALVGIGMFVVLPIFK